MSEPWFDPNHWAWLPGTLLGCSVGLWGSLIGVLVPLGKGRSLLTGFTLLLALLAAGSVVVGLIALAQGQPFGVWFFLVRQRTIEPKVEYRNAFGLGRVRGHEERGDES